MWKRKKSEEAELVSPTPKAERKIKAILEEDETMIEIINASRVFNDALVTAAEAGERMARAIKGSVLDEST